MCDCCQTIETPTDQIRTLEQNELHLCSKCAKYFDLSASDNEFQRRCAYNYFTAIQPSNEMASSTISQLLKHCKAEERLAESRAQERLQRIRLHIHNEETNQVKCPRCGSTQISTGARGWKWTTGFIGSGKTVNRCANCGMTWTPNYWDRQNR